MPRVRISRAKEVEEALRRQIDGGRGHFDRLPSETDIAGEFGVSRVTVREALSALERKGLILRRQGLGTFVNRDAREIQARLDESVEFGDLIRLSGYRSGVGLVESTRGTTAPEIAARLSIAPDADTLTVRKVFTANGLPVIRCLNVIPLELIPAERRSALLAKIDPSIPVYTLLSESFGHTVAYQIADLKPVTANEEIARHLSYFPGGPLLLIEEIGYDREQLPLFYASEYYVPGIIHFRLVRKPI
jgi:GntR family transcriptional regulator